MADEAPLSKWLADISANLLCVVLVLLAVLSLASSGGRSPTEATVPLIATVPLDGASAVELLYHGVEPPDDWLVLDLTSTGILEGGVPVDPAALNPAAGATLYVFDPAFYAETVAALERKGIPWREISVPDALQAIAPSGGGSPWAPAFLTLRTDVTSRNGFRAGLLDLLTGPGGLSDGGAASDGTGVGDATRFLGIRRLVNLTLCTTVLLVLAAVYGIALRRTSRAANG